MNRPLRFADLPEAWLDTVRSWVGVDKSVVASGQRSVGQRLIVDVTVSAGAIEGRFRRADSDANVMRITTSTLDAAQRTALDAVVAKRASFLADLLGHSISVEFDAALQKAGIDLLPGSSDVAFDCSCDEDAPCRHVVALAAAMTGRLVADPTLLFALRGYSVEHMLTAHRTRRSADDEDDAANDAGSTDTVDPASLAEPSVPNPLPKLAPATAQPGHPVGWPRPQPPETVDLPALVELADDAIERAWAMSVGDADSRLGLQIDVDLARRAVGHVGSSRIIELAKLIDVTGPRVIALATAWETAGAAGLDLLDAPRWYPSSTLMEEARQTIIGSGRRASSITVEANTITVAEKWQYRLGQDYQWYRFDLRSRHWHLFVPPAADIRDVLAQKKK